MERQKSKKREFMNRFERIYLLKYPRKYYERKIAISMKDRGQENKRFSINEESLNPNSDIIRFAMPSMCAASFSAEKKWLDKLAGSNWDQRVKINAEILKDGEIKKSI